MFGKKLGDYDTDELERELDETFADRNDWQQSHGSGDRPYEYELDTHADGIAVDIRENGGVCEQQSSMVCKPALRCGFVTTAVKMFPDRDSPKTGVFLRDLSEVDVSIDPNS